MHQCFIIFRELVNIKAQKVQLKRSLEHEKTRFKENISKLEIVQKQEVDKLNIKINELEDEIFRMKANAQKKQKHYFDDLGVGMLDVDGSSQKSSSSVSSAKPSSSQSSVSSSKTSTSTNSKNRVPLKSSTNTNKVKLPLQKSSTIFGTSRLSSSGISGLNKRMYNNAANLPDGMAYDGMGRTVKAESGFKPAVVKRFKTTV